MREVDRRVRDRWNLGWTLLFMPVVVLWSGGASLTVVLRNILIVAALMCVWRPVLAFRGSFSYRVQRDLPVMDAAVFYCRIVGQILLVSALIACVPLIFGLRSPLWAIGLAFALDGVAQLRWRARRRKHHHQKLPQVEAE